MEMATLNIKGHNSSREKRRNRKMDEQIRNRHTTNTRNKEHIKTQKKQGKHTHGTSAEKEEERNIQRE